MTMRVVVVGNEKIAADCLAHLLEVGQEVVAVATNSGDRPVLENRRLKSVARSAGLQLLEVEDINDAAVLEQLARMEPDLLFNLAFVQRYKPPVLSIPRQGCVNFHPGPLPKYGGSNGYVWSIINGETEYGVTFHYMREKIDAGDIVGSERFPIRPDETGLSLLMKCYERGTALFKKLVAQFAEGGVAPVPQNHAERSYYYNRVPHDGRVDVTWSATRICDFVRAMTFSPFPNPLSPPMIVAGMSKLIVKQAQIVEGTPRPADRPGTVVDLGPGAIVMQAADGLVRMRLSDPSVPGADTADVCRAMGIQQGSILGG